MKVLITGALGQIGSELTSTLKDKWGDDAVVATDIRQPDQCPEPFEIVDVRDRASVAEVVTAHDVDRVFHLASILSAAGEKDPETAFRVNVDGLYNVLEVCRTTGVDQVIVPSSIAVFGPTTQEYPDEHTVLDPTTMYGISKVLAEFLGEYYYETYGLDVRGLRLPGIISHETMPGGGTTDYAVEAFYEAVDNGRYTYFVSADTRLPMMYMPDAIRAIVGLSEADVSSLTCRCNYNVQAMSFTARELTEEIRKHVPSFDVDYRPDDRQTIADTWPNAMDDSAAREDWGWDPEYEFEDTVRDMIVHLST